jgi:hypothetical protein
LDNRQTIQLGTSPEYAERHKDLPYPDDTKKATYATLSKEVIKLLCLIEDEQKGGRSAAPWFDDFMYELGSANVLCGNTLVKVLVKINGLYNHDAYRTMSHEDIKRQIMDSKAILDHLAGKR